MSPARAPNLDGEVVREGLVEGDGVESLELLLSELEQLGVDAGLAIQLLQHGLFLVRPLLRLVHPRGGASRGEARSR